MFEKVATQHTNCTNGVTFQQLNTLNDNQVIKRINYWRSQKLADVKRQQG